MKWLPEKGTRTHTRTHDTHVGDREKESGAASL